MTRLPNIISSLACCLSGLIACLLATGAPAVRANDFATGFDTANQLYETGRFADAAAAYLGLMQTGNLSEALLFNRGNALFREGQLGRAIASYREALMLAPRDPDLRANLQFARTRARGGSPYHQSRWKIWLDHLSLDEWTAAFAAALWAFFLLLAATQWKPAWAPELANFIFGAGAATLVLGVCLGIELQANYFAQTAIVTAGESDVRQGPFDEAPSLFKVRDGIELGILDHKDEWLQVMDSAQRAGWVRKDQVLIFNPAKVPAAGL